MLFAAMLAIADNSWLMLPPASYATPLPHYASQPPAGHDGHCAILTATKIYATPRQPLYYADAAIAAPLPPPLMTLR